MPQVTVLSGLLIKMVVMLKKRQKSIESLTISILEVDSATSLDGTGGIIAICPSGMIRNRASSGTRNRNK